MVRFKNLKQCFFGIFTNTSSLKNVHAINVNAYKNVVILGILFWNNDSAFGDAFVQVDGIEPTHSMWFALKTQ